MKQYKDLTGKKFGKLEVLKLDHKKQKLNKKGIKTGSVYYWLCRCECGKEKVIRGSNLTTGLSQSCGCLRKEISSRYFEEQRTKHNLSKSRIYRIYKHMVNRCYLKTSVDYKNYGERGIKVCCEWKNDFKTFYDWAMANGYQEHLTIDRINNDGNYEPSNCRWVTKAQQGKNTRRLRNLTYKGETHNAREWSKIIGISVFTLYDRLNRGWSVEKTLRTPLKHQVQAIFKGKR